MDIVSAAFIVRCNLCFCYVCILEYNKDSNVISMYVCTVMSAVYKLFTDMPCCLKSSIMLAFHLCFPWYTLFTHMCITHTLRNVYLLTFKVIVHGPDGIQMRK